MAFLGERNDEMDYLMTLGIFASIYAILAISLNVLTGYAGQVSLGHAALFGIGAYTSAVLTVNIGMNYWAALPLSILITALVGSLLGLPGLRVHSDFLVLVTIGINFVVVAFFKYIPFFGGPYGLVNIPRPTLFGKTLDTPGYFLYALGWAVFVILFTYWMSKKYLRSAFEAIKEDEEAAEAMTVSVPRFKIYAFTISAAFAGLAGNLWAHYMGVIFPNDFSFSRSVEIMTMIVIGGVGTIRGAVLGALLLVFLPEYLRFVGDYRMLIYGLIIIFTMVFIPSGLLGDRSITWRWTKIFKKGDRIAGNNSD